MVNNKNPNSKFEYIDILVLMATGEREIKVKYN